MQKPNLERTYINILFTVASYSLYVCMFVCMPFKFSENRIKGVKDKC